MVGEKEVREIERKVREKGIYSKSTMTIVTTSGSERTFESESWSKDYGEKNLIRYNAPSRVKGQATLMLNHLYTL